MKSIFFLGLLVCSCLCAEAQEVVRLSSPDKKNQITFSIGAGGLSYHTRYGKSTVIARSLFSVQLADGEWTAGGVKKLSEKRGQVNGTYQLPSGKRSTYPDYYNSLEVTLKNRKGETGYLQIRAYNDGTAFRFVLKRTGDIQAINERTQFNLASKSPVYVQKWDKAYEGFYEPRRLDSLKASQILLFPALAKAGSDIWCLITEATTGDHYPGVQLQKDTTLAYGFKTVLPQASFAVKDSLITPWRVFITGSLATVTESSLVDNLNPPSQIADQSWIKPGVAVFPWWADHLASSNEDVLKKYADLAAEMGWEWIEFDVALVGTDYHTSRLWESTDWIADFVKYAHSKNIKVYGWDELKALNTPQKRAYVFGKYKALGIDGIKIDFLDSDAIEVMRFHREALEDAAKYHLLVSFHGETLPRGMRRTWPNLITHEAVRGAEYYTFPGYPEPDPVHNATLPFTRNVVGPMDYTPCTFSAKTRKTTYAHELALPFVFESGWMVMADAPEQYLNSPAMPILQHLEAAWDETILLDGYPGEYVVMARKKGATWVVAGINAATERTLSLDLKRLGIGNAQVEVYTDAALHDELAIQKTTIVNNSLKLPLKQNGGFVFLIEKE